MSEGRWSVLADFLTVVAVIGAFITAGFAGLEYFERREAMRAERTLKLVDLWEDERHRAAFRDLGSATLVFYRSVDIEDLAYARSNQRARENLERKLFTTVLGRENIRNQFETVTSFFARLSLCLSGNLCEHDVARTFFSSPFASVWNCYAPYIELQRSSVTSNVPGPLENLAVTLQSENARCEAATLAERR
ncbi:hypothetical protein [Pseudahrensia aquimaris]|uniref:hypothetical protein n=1 Tax=Pseudahrensia aquimaris TaxID=744461 RepID=UPI00366A7253